MMQANEKTEGGPVHLSREVIREVDCPRCHQQCGWCSDYRHMHGQLPLPGTRKYCTLTEVTPEGDDCPLCHGTKRAVMTTYFAPVQ